MRPVHFAWLAAFVLGLGAGIAYTWVLAPQASVATAPDTLRSDFKDEYRGAIAAAYSANGDLGRARARLALVGDADAVQALSAQAQRALAGGQSFEYAQELARLASDLQVGKSSVASPVPAATLASIAASTPLPGTTPEISVTTLLMTVSPQALEASPTAEPLTPTPAPSRTPIPTPAAPYRLESRDEICDPNQPAGLLKINILDARGHPLPGIEITVTWDQGQERFFTGLQPEINPGYADYTMQGGTTYAVQIARIGVPTSGLTAPLCSGTAGRSFSGGLQLTFSAP